MYDPAAVLAAVDAHPVPVLLLCGAALLGNAIYYFESMRLGFRDRVYTMPLAGLYFFIPHDMSYALLWHKWFVEYDHWFLKLFWLGLVLTSASAWVFLWQLLRYGHQELLPQVSRAVFTALVLGGLALSTGVWIAVKAVLVDDLYLFAFGLTAFWCAPFGMSLILRRRSSIGQSRLMWVGYTAIPVFYWLAGLLYLPPYFRSLPWLALGAAAVIWGLANLFVVSRLPKRSLAAPA
ncbi:MAG: hypothetical protein JWQ90_828 [Hydrocarboniphaga sp.]|nr:hypothetical protein [Hydrocarboniphaga sp.]